MSTEQSHSFGTRDTGCGVSACRAQIGQQVPRELSHSYCPYLAFGRASSGRCTARGPCGTKCCTSSIPRRTALHNPLISSIVSPVHWLVSVSGPSIDSRRGHAPFAFLLRPMIFCHTDTNSYLAPSLDSLNSHTCHASSI